MKSSQLLLKSIARGFTLIELLMASAMTLIVVTLAGIAVAQVIQGNLQTRADSQLQYNTNRAAEYISDEVRQATTIETDVTTAFNELKTKALTTYAGKFDPEMTPILILTIPNVSEKVVYYTIPRDRVNSGSMYTNHRGWLVGKPDSLVLYRWGYDRTKEDTGAGGSEKGTPAVWQPQPVLDNIDSTTTTSICGRDPTDPYNASATLTRIPAPPATAKGFSSCVAYSKKFAELHLKVSYQETNDAVTVQKPIEYEVNTQVATRASTPISVNGTSLTFISSGTLSVETGGIPGKGTSSLYSDSGGTVPITNGSNISITGQLPIGQPVVINLTDNGNTVSTSDDPSNTNARAYYNGSEIPSNLANSVPSSWKDPNNPLIFKLNSNQIIIRLSDTLYKFTLR